MVELAPELDVKLVDQSELELTLTKRANYALLTKESELDSKRLQKTTHKLEITQKKISSLERHLRNPRTKISQRKSLKEEIKWFQDNELQPLLNDIHDIQHRLDANKAQVGNGPAQALDGESERDFLMRTGKITAFGSSVVFLAANDSLKQSSVNLRAPGFLGTAERRVRDERSREVNEENDEHSGSGSETVQPAPLISPMETNTPETPTFPSDDDYSAGDSDQDVSDRVLEDLSEEEPDTEVKQTHSKRKKPNVSEQETETEAGTESELLDVQQNVDDGDEKVYQARLREWVQKRSRLRSGNTQTENTPLSQTPPESDEWRLPHPSIPDAVLNDDFRLPGDVFPALFDYQKTCVQWLWELYSQKTGGILGDEMGLGKTVQVIAFFAGLHYSGLLEKPVLLVVPATVLNQWVNEFHTWWPPLRCMILHSIGSGMCRTTVQTDEQLEAHLEQENPDCFSGLDPVISMRTAISQANAREIVGRVMEKGHVLVTTYAGLQTYSKDILPREWGYVVLDEGHKIRNPNLGVALACKRIKTHNRVILSGTPIQNNLVELWSLFDFVFPGRLGTLPVFEQQFSVPINMGGYANASNVQVQTGYQCAVVLRDLILPYLLRRLKADVAQDLPKKNEMVLFVRLTQTQQEMYERFLGSEDVGAILKGRRNVLMGVDLLRKICNHPDLVDREILQKRPKYAYGDMAKSGKMVVLKNLLQLWQTQNHRTLLFCQTKQMLDILEKFVANLPRISPDKSQNPEDSETFNYLRMDGSTPIVKRQLLVDSFNSNSRCDVFLLTTKVGGLGVNLTGADRVIIFDPDWNPSTDLQARERAWRLGQKRDITIYRLMTAGTIEEKIYHRQIFKTFLTNKILKDPKQRRFFKLNDLHDLFTLGDPDEKGTETGDMFSGREQKYSGEKERKSTRLLRKEHANDDDFYKVASIMGVSKLDKYAGDESKDSAEKPDKDGSHIMDGILSNSGIVHSTLKHDEIMDSSHSEMSLIEREASRVAKDAAAALKQSRISARKKAIGTPTWTGKFGTAGRFGSQKKALSVVKKPGIVNVLLASTDPLSSASILQGFRKGKVNGSPFKKKKKNETSGPKHDKESILKHLVDYLSLQPNHFSKSNAILQALPKSVDAANEKEIVTVRSLLREAADWKLELKGWKLKSAFVEKEEQTRD